MEDTKPREVLLVTGGSRGIGAAIVRRAIRRGYAVCFSFVSDVDAAKDLTKELEKTGPPVLSVQGDVADRDFASRFHDEAEREFGPVTAVVNNAGITGRYGKFADLPFHDLRKTIDVNLIGAMLVAQESVRRWQRRSAPGAAGERLLHSRDDRLSRRIRPLRRHQGGARCVHAGAW